MLMLPPWSIAGMLECWIAGLPVDDDSTREMLIIELPAITHFPQSRNPAIPQSSISQAIEHLK
jgi:hypothetical protein